MSSKSLSNLLFLSCNKKTVGLNATVSADGDEDESDND